VAGACLLDATMARGNGQEEVPVFSASGTVGMLSPCTALCTYFSTAFFVSSLLLSVIGDRVQGQGLFFHSILWYREFWRLFFQPKQEQN
jgi:preprotein translocase subunit SecG